MLSRRPYASFRSFSLVGRCCVDFSGTWASAPRFFAAGATFFPASFVKTSENVALGDVYSPEAERAASAAKEKAAQRRPLVE